MCNGCGEKANMYLIDIFLFYIHIFLFLICFVCQQGADVNLVNVSGDTPLHRASYTGREVAMMDFYWNLLLKLVALLWNLFTG